MTFEQDLAALAPRPAVADLLRDLRERRSLRWSARNGHLNLNPAPVGAIAVVAHPARVEIATEPDRAAVVCAGIPGARLRPATPATTRVVVDADVLAACYERVLEHALRALDWRATGPAWTADSRRGAVAATAPAGVCPDCRWERARSGACGCP